MTDNSARVPPPFSLPHERRDRGHRAAVRVLPLRRQSRTLEQPNALVSDTSGVRHFFAVHKRSGCIPQHWPRRTLLPVRRHVCTPVKIRATFPLLSMQKSSASSAVSGWLA